MNPSLLAVLFVVFAGLSVEVVRRGYLRWNRERDALARLGAAAPPDVVRRHRQAGRRLVSLIVALVAMIALAFLAPLRAPRAAIVAGQIIAVAALGLGIHWTVRS
ncbi:MAG TPA: hypothetical protein VK845_15750 [Gemmatimonadales bacterium]|nr:hypothetical protein [Gemmatimonadales bacterium]